MTANGLIDWTAVSIWNGSFRVMWSIALSVMIILCDMGYGPLISWFLSAKPFLLISKLSFAMYLLHINVYGVYFPSIKHVIMVDSFELFWSIASLYTVVAIVALIFHLVIEAPFAAMWSIMLNKIKLITVTKQTKVTLNDELKAENGVYDDENTKTDEL